MVFVLFFVTTSRCGQTLLFTKTYVIMSNKKDFWTVGRSQDVIFGIFCHFSSPITPLKMISQPKKNVNFRHYDFPQHFKYLIGFCVSPSQMVQSEIDFWGCEKTVLAANFGTPLAEGKWESVYLTQPLTYCLLSSVELTRHGAPQNSCRGEIFVKFCHPLKKVNFCGFFYLFDDVSGRYFGQ